MSFIEVKQGKAFYCEVEVDGHAVGGIFTIAGGDIELRLVRFDAFFHLEDNAALQVRTEANWFASLFDTVPLGTGQHGHSNNVAYNQKVLANTALIGWTPWAKTDTVRRTRFRVAGGDMLLRHRPTFEKLANTEFGKGPEHVAIDVPFSEGRVEVHYDLSGSMDGDYPTEVWPVTMIEFTAPTALDSMRRSVIAVLRFLSACASANLRTEEQTVSSLSQDEWLAALGRKDKSHDHSVYYYRASDEVSPVPTASLYGAFAHMHDDEERAAFGACISAWLARYPEWEGAASLMADAFSQQEVMNPQRLLTATKWLEQTPGTASLSAMKSEHTVALAKLLANGAGKLGYNGVFGRLRNAFSNIRLETSRKRFERIVSEIRVVFGDGIVGDDMVDWLCEAFTLRGTAAHGAIMRQSEMEYQLFSKATHAAECAAYLLMVKDLPMSDKGRKRAASAKLVEFYRVEIMGDSPKKYKAGQVHRSKLQAPADGGESGSG